MFEFYWRCQTGTREGLTRLLSISCNAKCCVSFLAPCRRKMGKTHGRPRYLSPAGETFYKNVLTGEVTWGRAMSWGRSVGKSWKSMENTGKSWDIYIYMYVGNPLAMEVSSWEIHGTASFFTGKLSKNGQFFTANPFSLLLKSPQITKTTSDYLFWEISDGSIWLLIDSL